MMQALKNGNYGVQQKFIQDANLLKRVFQKLELMEVEGRYFMLHKSPLPIEQRVRTDKAYNFHMSHIENIPEFECLMQLGRLLSYIPFELNSKQSSEMPMQVQICEVFEISYFDRDHQIFRLRRDNAPIHTPQDTGVKLTAMLVINKDDKTNKDYGELLVRSFQPHINPTQPP